MDEPVAGFLRQAKNHETTDETRDLPSSECSGERLIWPISGSNCRLSAAIVRFDSSSNEALK
jgi:hypothetical protein